MRTPSEQVVEWGNNIYLHKGWISVSDTFYQLHGFHTSSTSEMDMHKELYIIIHIYIY